MARNYDTYYTFIRNGEEYKVFIEYSISSYIPAQTYGPAENCYPAEGGEVEILKVTEGETEIIVELTEKENEEFSEWAFQQELDADDYDLHYDDYKDYE